MPTHRKSVLLVAQNVPNSDWEKKVTEYFREKLKENNATNWVRLCFFFQSYTFLKICSFSLLSTAVARC